MDGPNHKRRAVHGLFAHDDAHDPVRGVPRRHVWRVNARRQNAPLGELVEDIVQRLPPVSRQIGQLIAELAVEARLCVCRTFDDEDGVEDEGTPPELAARG